MNIEQFRECCLSLPLATEDMPFDDTVLVFRLKGKIFGAIILDKPNLVVLKCEPEYALELRERYPEIEGAHHWNKKYWNQIHLDGQIPDELVESLCRHSFGEVNKKLPKKEQIEFNC
ncbi:MAG: MmcQ/YjbR family DNA-binding protein [Bacteroidales bacterium]|nr:MmcQ/YjbR family DNA-binding protein [Bacteroidales bacterium]